MEAGILRIMIRLWRRKAEAVLRAVVRDRLIVYQSHFLGVT